MPKYLFRGTTIGYRGNPNSEDEFSTSTSKNPFLAYLFAKESRKYGSAVILIFDEDDFDGRIGDGNSFEIEEDEVILSIRPIDAFNQALKLVGIEEFRTILTNLELNMDDYATYTQTNRCIVVQDVPQDILEELTQSLLA